MFVARSCTKWVYLIFAINRADLKHHLRNNPMKDKKRFNFPSYKKGCFAVRSCTRYVYLIFAVNLAAYMFKGVFSLFSWWCCTARFKAVLLYVVIQDRYLSITA